MALKSDAKFKEKLTCGFKYDIRNLVNFHPKFHFDGVFLSKVYEVWAKKIQRIYLSWHWTAMQNLKKPDLVVSEMAWGIGWTLIIRAPKSLKIVHWWALFVQSIYCFSQKRSEELCVKTQKDLAKFKRKLSCRMKNDIRNSMVNFHASSLKSKHLHFLIGSVCPKYTNI